RSRAPMRWLPRNPRASGIHGVASAPRGPPGYGTRFVTIWPALCHRRRACASAGARVPGSAPDREAEPDQKIIGAVTEADAGPRVHCKVRCDEIDEASHGIVPGRGRPDPAGRIECVPLDEALQAVGELEGARQPGGELEP